MIRFVLPMTLLLACLLSFSSLAAQTAPATSQLEVKRVLVVGVKIAPPFVIKKDKAYSGLAIDLWQEIAGEHGWAFKYREYDLSGLLTAVRDDEVDVGLGAITATVEREQNMDFTYLITSSGLGVAVRKQAESGWLAVLRALLSPAFLKIIALLVVLLLAVGFLAWLFEHKHNIDEFGGRRSQGIFTGFWWAMVTMTTVGYGDISPRTVPGRILGMIWMLAALVVVSFFTASITSVLTVGQLSSQIRNANDLDHVRIASLAGSTSGKWLERQYRTYVHADSLDAALKQLAADKVDVVVYDAPLLRWKIRRQYSDRLSVLQFTMERQDYAFALPKGSALREPINTSLLKRINSPDWQQRMKKYLGD